MFCGFYNIWQNFDLPLAIFLPKNKIFIAAPSKWPNIEKIIPPSGHTVLELDLFGDAVSLTFASSADGDVHDHNFGSNANLGICWGKF